METVINAIIENNYDSFVNLITKKGADIADNNGFTPLIVCCQNGRIKMIDFLLSQKIDINKKNSLGNTALFYAVYFSRNKTEIIEKLLKHGADKNIPNKAGVTPLSLANSMANEKVKEFMNNYCMGK